MHIPDGIIPAPVCLAGYAAAAGLMWVSLRRIGRLENPREGITRASLLTAAFLVASWIHIPVPPASVHLMLNGLLGAVLGYYAIPAIFIGLFFQAVLFQHGGLTTLGVNGAIIGATAIISYHIFQLRIMFGREARWASGVFGFLAGATGMGLSALAVFVILFLTIPAHLDVAAERTGIYILTLAHLPVIVIEGLFTALVAMFLLKVKPELLEGQ